MPTKKPVGFTRAVRGHVGGRHRYPISLHQNQITCRDGRFLLVYHLVMGVVQDEIRLRTIYFNSDVVFPCLYAHRSHYRNGEVNDFL